ncbi:MAG: cardiolipin synthase [Lachnospiraceae bacterium]|nr:cardiolipin synthase [Lachnospiraceae bacterium]
MKKTSKRLIGRIISVALAVLFQVLWIIFAVVVLRNRFPFVAPLIELISIIAILWLVSKDINPAYKLAWTILILAVPVAGAVIYLMFGKSRLGKEMQDELDASFREASKYLAQDEEVKTRLEGESKAAGCQSAYIQQSAGFPVYQKTKTKYFRVGEELYSTLLGELKKAEHYIFMEYFIIDDGEMWQGILDILEEKARLGLDVRLIYDDWGCASTMPKEFQMSLQRRGIRCEVFNPLMPIASVLLNNRDHRKITVIDGYIGFTGGINLADEYINRKERFGYWKDTGIMLEGEAVWSFTVMFLQMWSVLARDRIDYGKYRPHEWHEQEFEDDGFVQPYGDTPLDHETVGESVYLNIINRAKKYVYIFTPYLITDNEMITALCLAAKSGIDVRIVTPGIPDKKLVFLLTRSYYDTLLAAGVRIYEYKPGFLHAKSFVCDDRIATVGTINLDYRSLYLHFECGVWMYHSDAVMQIKEDALSILEECREVTMEDCQNKRTATRIGQSILRLFAPLL